MLLLEEELLLARVVLWFELVVDTALGGYLRTRRIDEFTFLWRLEIHLLKILQIAHLRHVRTLIRVYREAGVDQLSELG